MNNCDILIIGAGCGGLTAAAYAAKEGKKALVLERRRTPGGLMTSFVRGRFEFETAARRLDGFGYEKGAGELRRMLEELGVAQSVATVPLPDLGHLLTVSADGSPIDFKIPFGPNAFLAALDVYAPGSKASVARLFDVARELEKLEDAFADDAQETTLRVLHKTFGDAVRALPYSVNEVLDAVGVPHKAREILTCLWPDLGVDCDRLNFAHYILHLYRTLRDGAQVPHARSYDLAMALTEKIEENGGAVRCASPVSKILFTNGEATGVVLRSGEEIHCNHIIADCSPTTVFAKMMKLRDVPKTALKRTNARKLGMRSACVYLGLNRSTEELGIADYSVICDDTADTKRQFEAMKSIETNHYLTATCPNVADAFYSPAGTAVLTLETRYTDNCWADVSPARYFEEKDRLAARLITLYEQATGIAIHANIEELEVATPVTFARYTDAPKGVTHGYLAAGFDSVPARLMTEQSDCDTKGLRFCGGFGTLHCGIGAAAASGRNALYATLNDMNGGTNHAG